MRMAPRKPGTFAFFVIRLDGLHSLVNERSIASLKRRALRRTKTLRHDSETQTVIHPSRISKMFTSFTRPFTREYWIDMMEPSDDEKLVDLQLLSYSYLEAGLIETIGA